jgi:hypothetical protein
MTKFISILTLLSCLHCGSSEEISSFVANYGFTDNLQSIGNAVKVTISYNRNSGEIDYKRESNLDSSNESFLLTVAQNKKEEMDSYLDKILLEDAETLYEAPGSDAPDITIIFKTKKTDKTIVANPASGLLPNGLTELIPFITAQRFK